MPENQTNKRFPYPEDDFNFENNFPLFGDHHNDVTIAKIAGLSIAFDAKNEELRRTADVVIDRKDLREVLKYIV